MTSPFYPTNHTLNGVPKAQQEVFEIFRQDQCMRVAAWLQSGGEFYSKQELDYGKH